MSRSLYYSWKYMDERKERQEGRPVLKWEARKVLFRQTFVQCVNPDSIVPFLNFEFHLGRKVPDFDCLTIRPFVCFLSVNLVQVELTVSLFLYFVKYASLYMIMKDLYFYVR
jgi:hypothetical protein